MKKGLYIVVAIALLVVGVVVVVLCATLSSSSPQDPATLNLSDVRVIWRGGESISSLDLSHDCKLLLLGITKNDRHTTLIVDTTNGLINGSVPGKSSARWSPDTTRFVADGTSAKDVKGIAIYGATGMHLKTLDTQGYSPQWSPDGKNIAYLKGKWGSEVSLSVVPADGGSHGGSPWQLTGDPFLSAPLQWMSPQRIMYPVGETVFYWYAWDLSRNTRSDITSESNALLATVSPDGEKIAYEKDGAGIWIVQVTTKREYRIAKGHAPLWIRNSNRILYAQSEGSDARLTTFWTVDPDGSQPKPVPPHEGVLASSYVWCPSATSFVFSSFKDGQAFVGIVMLE